MITLHTIAKNEEKFIKVALQAALSHNEVGRALVWDTGSSDNTETEILSIKDKRIEFQRKGNVDKLGLVRLRNEQLKTTKTPWFMLMDGDEIWPKENLHKLILVMKQCSNETIALVNRTRNVVGDIFHYLPESEGHYQIGLWSGHLNVRAIRNSLGLTVRGVYPNEWYERAGKKIQDQPERLTFVDTWYLHATHLKRSGNWISELLTVGRFRKRKWLSGLKGKRLLKMGEEELRGIYEQI